MHLSLFSSATDRYPEPQEGDWSELATALAEPRETACTLATCAHAECEFKNGGAWSPVEYPAGATRGKRSVIAVHAFVADLDHLPPDELAAALERFAGIRAIVHASHSDRPEDRCARVVCALTRPVLNDEWPRFWLAVMSELALPIPADPTCKDSSRLYYMPSRPSDALLADEDGTGYLFLELPGEPIDVDAVLASAPTPKAETPRPAASPAPRPVAATSSEPVATDRASAVAALGEMWPRDRALGGRGGRHLAGVALCGALARLGIAEEDIAEFVSEVADHAEPGNGEYDKWLAAAISSTEKFAAGEFTTGWPALAAAIGRPLDDLSPVMTAMGVAPRGPSAAFAKMVALVPARAAEPPPEPPRKDIVLAALRKARKKLGVLAEGLMLARVLKESELCEHGEPIEDAVAEAASLLVHYAPPGTDPKMLAAFLVRCTPQLSPKDALDAIAHFRANPRAEPAAAARRDLDAAPPANDEELLEGLSRTPQGEPKSTKGNVKLILQYASDTAGRLRFNAMTKKVEVLGAGRFADCGPNMLDTEIGIWLEQTWGVSVMTSIVGEVLLYVAQKFGTYEPVQEYLSSVRRDSRSRLDTWLIDYCHVEDTEYVRRVGAMWMISAVARAFRPGCQVDTVLVLEGEQGFKKSTTMSILGGKWFSNTPLRLGDKDAYQVASSYWIIELAELASFRAGEAEAHKAFLTSPEDVFRPPYGRVPEPFARRCVFGGTTNEDEYLVDHTGGRRFLSVRVRGVVDTEALRRDRDLLWAEAVERYMNDETWWFEEADQRRLAAPVAESRRVEDSWIGVIHDWYARVSTTKSGMPGARKFTLAECAVGALDIDLKDLPMKSKQLGRALREAGFHAVKVKHTRLWEPKVTPPLIAVEDRTDTD